MIITIYNICILLCVYPIYTYTMCILYIYIRWCYGSAMNPDRPEWLSHGFPMAGWGPRVLVQLVDVCG